MKSIIELENVRKIYQLDSVKVEALRGINLSINESEFVSIVGPSGSGKSTLLHIVGALDRPTSGNVYIDGVNISMLKDSELARIRGRKIGFVFQFFNLYPTLTALENVELPMVIFEYDKEKRRKKALKLLKVVGLEDRADHLPSQLSGGERQRVAIARALANDAPIILADEPTGNLDSESSKEIMELFIKLNRKGRTIVVVTHDPTIAEYSENIVNIVDGQVAPNHQLIKKYTWGKKR